MNELIRKMALDAGILNYEDRNSRIILQRYYIPPTAKEDEVHDFAKLIIYDFLSELMNDDSLGAARIEIIKRLAEKWGVTRSECW